MSTECADPNAYAVLYVDDEEQALKYFRKGLGKDFRILTASSGNAAMTLLEQQAGTIGVVITDQRMPGTSGVGLLTGIRERWPDIVRVLITAYTDIDSAVAAVNAGAVYKYVNKPADFQLLRQVLTEALALHRETIHRNALAATLKQLEEQRRAREAAEAQREQLQQRLLAASREAGRAEVATGILHNVGNVLNSMNISASVVNHTLQESRVGNLCKGLAMLEEHSHDLATFISSDERGKRLPGYLIELASVLTEEQTTIVEAMRSLNHNIEHIIQIVRMQQSNAKEIILHQSIMPTELMEDAVRVNLSGIQEHCVEVVRHYETLPALMLDQHRVLQILVNLVANAVHAVCDALPEKRQIDLSVQKANEGGTRQVRFQVSDSGVGILPENLTRIFTYGFTTRQEGHGFGLHSAANAAKEMGGSLTASSEGTGRGAVFTLDLPMNTEGEVAAGNGSATERISA